MVSRPTWQWQRPIDIESEINRPSAFPIKLKALRWLGKQTWIPHGRHGMLALCHDPYTCKPYSFEIDFFGLRYRGDLSHIIDWNVFMYGSYAYPELSLLSDVTQEMKRRRGGSVNFFDIGANVGQHTLYMAQFADHVFAFEPFPAVRALINDKVSLNRLSNVEIVPLALGCSDEELSYFPGSGRNSGMGTLVSDHGDGFADPIKVSVRNGDRLFDELGLPRLDVIKIDVEGFEPFALRGLSQHIRKDRPVILTEISDFSRQNLGSEAEFRALFYDDAMVAEVRGRAGCRFETAPFNYATSREAVIFPPDWAGLLRT